MQAKKVIEFEWGKWVHFTGGLPSFHSVQRWFCQSKPCGWILQRVLKLSGGEWSQSQCHSLLYSICVWQFLRGSILIFFFLFGKIFIIVCLFVCLLVSLSVEFCFWIPTGNETKIIIILQKTFICIWKSGRPSYSKIKMFHVSYRQ